MSRGEYLMSTRIWWYLRGLCRRSVLVGLRVVVGYGVCQPDGDVSSGLCGEEKCRESERLGRRRRRTMMWDVSDVKWEGR
jgi:hypothetical protein